LQKEVYTGLNYPELLEGGHASEFMRLHECEWGRAIEVGTFFNFRKLHVTLQEWQADKGFHVVYYDAFAPSKQPEMWGLELIRKTTDALYENGVWVTYCAKGQLKRDLMSLGMRIDKIPGPPGKKEMIRAFKSDISGLG